jgi:hypothetical protein
VQIAARTAQVAAEPQADALAARPTASLDVTEFEVACYLANYKEIDSR